MSESRTSLALAAALFALTATVAAAPALEDPTRPSYLRQRTSDAGPAKPAWRVESILVSPGRRLAVINDRVVGVNDHVNGARVVEILPYEVTIEYQGALRRLALVPVRVKRPAD